MSQIHPRVQLVNSAGHAIRESIDRAISELTYAEVAWLLSDILHSYTSDALKVERAEPEPHTHYVAAIAPQECTRGAGHDGPCNGFPRTWCAGWSKKRGPRSAAGKDEL